MSRDLHHEVPEDPACSNLIMKDFRKEIVSMFDESSITRTMPMYACLLSGWDYRFEIQSSDTDSASDPGLPLCILPRLCSTHSSICIALDSIFQLPVCTVSDESVPTAI